MVADLVVTTRLGESMGKRAERGGTEAVHRLLAEKIYAEKSDDLHKTAFVNGYLSALDATTVQHLLVDAYLDNPTMAKTHLYTQAYFPPAMRTVAAILKRRPDSEGVEIAESAATEQYFTLLDQPGTFELFSARDTHYDATTMLWALPEAESDAGKILQMSESYDAMLDSYNRGHGKLRDDIGCQVGVPSPDRLRTNTPLDIDNPNAMMVTDFLAGMRREQTAAAVHTGGKRPLHALVTNWPGLATRASSDELTAPLVDQVFHFVPSVNAVSGDASTTGRLTTVPMELNSESVRFDSVFPLHRLDLDRVANLARGVRRTAVIRARVREVGAIAGQLGRWQAPDPNQTRPGRPIT